MSKPGFELRGIDDARLAAHAVSPLPAWLWSIDGTRILWANPVGASVFGAKTAAALAGRTFGPADQHRRQVAQLAARLPADATRLERLRGFGSRLGALVTCSCARLDFADGGIGILVVAAQPVGRSMPLVERLQRLVEGIETPIAAFARDGMFVGASDAARALLGFRSLSDAGLDAARSDALRDGRVETPIGIGHMVLQRVGSGSDVGLVALLAPGAAMTVQPTAAPPETPDVAPSDMTPTDAVEATGHLVVEPLVKMPPTEASVEDETSLPSEMLVDEFADEQKLSSPEPVTEPSDAAADAAEVEPATMTPSLVESDVTPALSEPTITDSEPALSEPEVEVIIEPEPAFTEPDAAATIEPDPAPALAPASEPELIPERLHPLRFLWQIDRDGIFTIASDEFTQLIGPRHAAYLGQSWTALQSVSGIDADDRVAQALATQDTWSGITVAWPTDEGTLLPVELSALPVHDETHGFAGYRGFGVCRDVDAMNRAAAGHRDVTRAPSPLSADIVQAGPAPDEPAETIPVLADDADAADVTPSTFMSPSLEQPAVDTSPNVVPFRPTSDTRPPMLTPVENNAFDELARQLSARLDNQEAPPAVVPAPDEMVANIVHDAPAVADEATPADADQSIADQPTSARPEWLTMPPPAPRSESRRDRPLFDLLLGGVLVYRLDRLLYANPAFLRALDYDDLAALEEAGGLDALVVEPGVSTTSSASGSGKPVTISLAETDHAPPARIDAQLFAIDWDGDSAHALLCMPPQPEPVVVAPEPLPAGQVDAEELGAILDTTAEGIVMFDGEGRIHACNRSAEALFGYSGEEMLQKNFSDLFAAESQRPVADYLDGVKKADLAGLLEHGREALGRVREGGLIPLSLTMGRTRQDGPNFFVVFRDLSQVRKSEGELLQAKRLAERAAGAKADVLARISHEVRMPLNAIIGFAEVMIDERFGALGNERYVEYMKDIRASGERVVAIINDLLDLSQIETGKLNLSFASQNLNDLVEQCVAVMQPQANRERIIIRTSLAHTLPPVTADARSLRQVTLNLIGNSIHLANTGGQVIVSTALSDANEVVLRVRDTGHGMNDNEVAAAMEPFRTPAPEDRTSRNSAVSLSLIKALVEANRARFAIKATSHGTLVEVTFAHTMAGV